MITMVVKSVIDQQDEQDSVKLRKLAKNAFGPWKG
jgi:hypothetical protein